MLLKVAYILLVISILIEIFTFFYELFVVWKEPQSLKKKISISFLAFLSTLISLGCTLFFGFLFINKVLK